MAEKLVIRLLAEGAADWVRLSPAGQVLEGANGVAIGQLPRPEPSTGVQVLAAAEHCLLTQAELPIKQRARMLKALPYALEEQLAENVDDLHLVAGPWDEGVVPVAVVRHRLMEEWLEALESAGISANRMLPEPLALPYEEGSVSLLLEPKRVVLRWGRYAGGGFDLSSLDLVLKQVAGDKTIRLWRTPDAPKPRRQEGKQVETIDQATPWIASSLVSDAGAGKDATGAMELLRPPYASNTESAGLAKRLRLAAVLAGVWLVAQFAFAGVDYLRLKSEADSLYEQQFELFRSTFPERTRIQQPVAQMRQELEAMRVLRGMGAQSGPLALLGGAGQALQASTQVVLESFNYRDGVLEFSLRSPDMAQLEALRQRIERSSEFTAELTGNSMTASGISGRIRVARGARTGGGQ